MIDFAGYDWGVYDLCVEPEPDLGGTPIPRVVALRDPSSGMVTLDATFETRAAPASASGSRWFRDWFGRIIVRDPFT